MAGRNFGQLRTYSAHELSLDSVGPQSHPQSIAAGHSAGGGTNEHEPSSAACKWSGNRLRKMNPLQNERLANYFRSRHIRLLEADEKPPKLSLYQRQ